MQTQLYNRVLILIVAVAAAVIVAGCGETGAVSGEHAGSLSEEVDLDLWADYSLSGDSEALGRDRVDAAVDAVEPVLAAGGHLRVVLFSRSAPQGGVLVDQAVPPLAELAGIQRTDFENEARLGLEGALEQAYGLKPATPAVRELTAPVGRGGSDVAGAFRTGVEEVQEGSARSRQVVVLSDGLQNTPEFDLVEALESAGLTEALEIASPFVPDARGVELALIGAGASDNRKQATTERALLLQEFWRAFCSRASAASCDVRITP